MIAEQIVKDSGREALGSSLSSAKVWTSSNFFFPVFSSSDRLDSQKAWLTTFVLVVLVRDTGIPLEPIFPKKILRTQKTVKSLFIFRNNICVRQYSLVNQKRVPSHCPHHMKERSNVKRLGTRFLSPDLTNGPELMCELLRETDHFTFSTFAQNIRSTDPGWKMGFGHCYSADAEKIKILMQIIVWIAT